MKFVNELMLPLFIVGIVGIGGNTLIQEQDEQEIEIIDQDGQQVDAKRLKWRNADQQDNADIKVGDGKIIVVDENGERREIDVTGAQNIIVNKSVRSIIRDGEEEKQVTGKAIIVGPDGQKQVIQLGGDLEPFGDGMRLHVAPFFQGDGEGQRLPGKFFFGQSSVGKYVIGVNCNPVNDQLRAHLDLDEGIGLVVSNEPTDNSPAGQRGIKRHDILMYADQTELATVKDLIGAVQLAGKEDRELSLTLIRKGKELGIDVKPTERKAGALGGEGRALFLPGEGDFDFRFEEFGPGVIFGDGDEMPADILQKMEAIDERIKARMEELTQLQEEFRRSLPNLKDRKLEKDDD